MQRARICAASCRTCGQTVWYMAEAALRDGGGRVGGGAREAREALGAGPVGLDSAEGVSLDAGFGDGWG